MTEQPDTTAIRAAINAARWPAGWQILDLCDALDVARAELEEYKFALVAWKEEACVNRDRAEAAEARIDAALLVCCNYEWCGDGMECEVRRALTEGTSQ